MTGRRRTPDPVSAPVGGNDKLLAPPEEFEYDPNVLASTDPSEAPPPPPLPEDQMEKAFLDDKVAAEHDQIAELSPEEMVMFASLLTCGRRSKTIRLFDHTVVVQTLCGDDDLRIGLYVKDYAGSLGEQRAYQIGVVAAGIRTIDGRPLVQGLYEKVGEDVLFNEKVDKVAKMYPTVISRIYRAVMDSEKEFVELANKLGKLDG